MPKRYVQYKFAFRIPAIVSVLCALMMLGAGTARAQISNPYTESFGAILANDAFPLVPGGSWGRSGSVSEQPTYKGPQPTGNRISRGTDTSFITFAGAQPANGNIYWVGPFQLTTGMSYRASVYYITDGSNGFGPLQLTYGTANTVVGQTNVIASVAPNVTASSYTQLQGLFVAPSSGLYYMAVKLQTTGTPGFLSVDDFMLEELPACSASPNPGNTIASATSACPTTTLRLSLQNQLLNSGITIQWQSSSNGVTYADVTTGTGRTDSVYFTQQSAATWYRAKVTCTAGSLISYSTPVQVTMSALASCYCTPAGTSTAHFINNFATFGATSNISSLGTGAGTTSAGYTNFLSRTASAYQGNTVGFTASFGTSTTLPYGFSVWVDWNQNGDFGAGELAYSSTAATANVSGSFVVPAGALPGNTRMRIRAEHNISVGPAACGTLAESEAEDYTLTVLAMQPCTGTPTPNRIVTYSNIPVTGFNADVIANGPGGVSASTNADFDGAGYNLLDSTFQATATSPLPQFGLPVTGLINTPTAGLSFRLASATGSNSLRLGPAAASAKLTVTTPVAADTLYLLAASGGGASTTINVTVGFANSTTETINGFVVGDYYTGAAAPITGFGRVNASNVVDGTATAPRMYIIAVPISASNQGLNINEITVAKTGTTGITNILAVSGKTPAPRPVCAGTPGRVLTMPYIKSSEGITFQWMEASSPGGPYVNVTGGSRADTVTYVTPVASTTKYYVLRMTCSNSTSSAISNEIAVTVLANPTVSTATTPSSSKVCGSNPVTITATGTGTSYLWYPANGLSATNVAAPVANPTSSTFYYVLNTAANGCTAIATRAVGVFSSPTLTASVLTPTICAGGQTTLKVVDSNFGVAAQIATYTNGTVTNPATDEDIANVVFGSMTNATACVSLAGTIGTATGTAGSYSDFTAAAPQRYLVGQQYGLSVTTHDCNAAAGSSAVAVYIDYNMNGVFTDAGEEVYASTAPTAGVHTESANVTIPYTARLGVTRMRVIVNKGLVTGPQMSPANGEIEDYVVRIIRAGVINPTSSTGFTWSPNTTLSPTTGATVVSTGLTATTTFTVTGTDTNSCAATATVTVNVNPLPVLTITPAATGTPAATSICLGSTATLVASGAGATGTYTWSPNTAISTTTGTTVTVGPSVATDYTVTGTDANGCIGKLVRKVLVDTIPVITVTPATASVCFGSSVSLTASGAGAGTYSWSPAATATPATGATVSVNPTTATTYTVTGTNARGCIGTATRNVTINALPVISISSIPSTAITTICSGDSVTMTASGAGTTGTYAWTPASSLNVANVATVKAGPTTTTTYTVTGTDANGCKSTATKQIFVNTLPTVAIAPTTATALCGGGKVQLAASGATSYVWTPSTGLSGTTTAVVDASPTVTTTYTVTGTDANGCKNTATKTVTFNPLPVITIAATNASPCSGDSATLVASGGGTGATYAWSPNTNVNTTTGATIKAAPTATTTYTVTATDANGCVGTKTQAVTVLTRPTVTTGPTAATAICNGGTARIWAQGGTSWTWAPSASVTPGPGAGDTVIVNPTATTTYTVTATGTNGCTSTATKVVTVRALPTISIAPATAAVCIGSSLTLTASGAATYAWSPSATLSAATGTSVTATPTVNTTYTVTGTDANGCVNTTTKLVTVNALPTISVSPSTLSVVCAGSPITLTASGATTYSWTPTGSLNTSTLAAVVASPTTTTTYTVTGTDANGCSNTATKTVNVNALPPVAITPTTAIGVCLGQSATLTATGALSYSWTPSGTLSASTGATVIATPSITTAYTVTGTDGNGCTNTATKTVTINPIPVISIASSNGGIICDGTNTVLTASGAATYVWTPAATLSSSTGTSVTATPTTNTTYTVTGTTVDGCVSTASRTIGVLPKPNAAITPTGTITICQGDTVTLSGLPGYTAYSWRTYGTPIAAATGMTYRTFTGGFYTLRVTGTNGCTDTTLTPTIINVIQAPNPAILRNGATLSADAPYASYQWYLNGAPITGATGQFYNPTQNGFYTLSVTSQTTGCRGTSASYNYTNGVGVPNTAGVEIKVYPNPATEQVRIEAPMAVRVRVVAMDGKLVFESENATAIDVRNWADGVYRVQISDAQGNLLKVEKVSKISR